MSLAASEGTQRKTGARLSPDPHSDQHVWALIPKCVCLHFYHCRRVDGIAHPHSRVTRAPGHNRDVSPKLQDRLCLRNRLCSSHRTGVTPAKRG